MATRTKGKTTKGGKSTGKKITKEQIKKAREAGQFMKAAEAGALKLTGAVQRWVKNPKVVYNLEYRVVGSEKDIRALLERSGFSQKDIDKSFKDSTITRDNYTTTMTGDYDEEIKMARAARSSQKKKQEEEPEYDLEDLAIIVSKLGSTSGSVLAPKGAAKSTTTKTKSKTKDESPKKGRKPRQPLPERLDALKKDSVIDVSNITPEGSKAKTLHKAPTGGKRVGIKGLPIISNNYAAYAIAIDLLPDEYQHFKEEFAKEYGKGDEVKVKAKAASPKTKSRKTTAATKEVTKTKKKKAEEAEPEAKKSPKKKKAEPEPKTSPKKKKAEPEPKTSPKKKKAVEAEPEPKKKKAVEAEPEPEPEKPRSPRGELPAASPRATQVTRAPKIGAAPTTTAAAPPAAPTTTAAAPPAVAPKTTLGRGLPIRKGAAPTETAATKPGGRLQSLMGKSPRTITPITRPVAKQ